MEHQNWGYTVLSKKATSQPKGDKAVTKALREGKDVDTMKKDSATNKIGAPTNVAKILESEEFKVDTVSHDLKIAIQQARNAKKLKQTELATKINEKASVISEYESGRAIPNPAVLSKLEKALGVKLPRPKKKKAKKGDDSDD